MNLTEIFRQSRLNTRAEYVEKEVLKRGVLRAGNSGVITDQGEVAGSCIRKSHLRSLGIELESPEENTLIMFDLGYANEDIITGKLQKALPPGHIMLREEEIPIEWFTSNGSKVTGRPDIVICMDSYALDPSGTGQVPTTAPVLGLELKSVHSIWTAKDVLFHRKPKLSNLAQAAHYMWKLGVPYKLVYTSYSQLGQGMGGQNWITKHFPNQGEPNSEYIEYNSSGGIKHLRQFEIVYDLRFDSKGKLQYKMEAETDKQWTDTIVSIDGLESFYEFASQVGSTGQLGPRPAKLDTLGGEAGYRDCDYCPLNKVCSSHENKTKEGRGLIPPGSYEDWLRAVRAEVTPTTEKRKGRKKSAVRRSPRNKVKSRLKFPRKIPKSISRK